MLSTYRRFGIVVVLLVLSGGLGAATGAPARPLALPPVSSLLKDSGWRVARQDAPVSYTGSVYQVYQLVDGRGHLAQLYVGAESVQKMIHWSGELGFEGAGYVALRQDVGRVRLPGGVEAPFSLSVEQHLADRQLEEYAVVSPDYIAAHAADNLARTGWDVLRGHAGRYYVARVAMPSPVASTDAAAQATLSSLLAHVLTGLSVAAA